MLQSKQKVEILVFPVYLVLECVAFFSTGWCINQFYSSSQIAAKEMVLQTMCTSGPKSGVMEMPDIIDINSNSVVEQFSGGLYFLAGTVVSISI